MVLVGGRLRDAAVEQVDGPDGDDAPRLPRVSALAVHNEMDQPILLVPCGRCGVHRHGARSLPGVFFGTGCNRPVVVESARWWPEDEPFEIEEP